LELRKELELELELESEPRKELALGPGQRKESKLQPVHDRTSAA
jgi:hypothetical protein